VRRSLIVDDGCGRYVLNVKAKDLTKRYNLSKMPHDIRENYNVAPGQIMPVITKNDDGEYELEHMKWGFIPVWSKDPSFGYKLINARDDNLFKSPIWRSVILKKRAIIPATGFYEWKKPENPKERKQPFYIHPKQLDIFSFAGIWGSWKDVEGKEWKTYSIITTEPNKEMRQVHNRMPVILYQDEESSWLEPSNVQRDGIEPFLHPFEDEGLDMFKVSSDVNTVKNNNAKLIVPVSTQ
jgi:putative SOS response-associated peptidase YedK